jgi:hypothetical protein
MPPRRRSGPSLESIRAGEARLTRTDLLEASARLLAALRRNVDTVSQGVTPGTTRADFMQRTEARAFWNRKGRA